MHHEKREIRRPTTTRPTTTQRETGQRNTGQRRHGPTIAASIVCTLLVAAGLLAWVAAPAAAAQPDPNPTEHAGWLPPVDASVVDPFRAPATRFSAGNRGLEYATAGGETVRAVDEGRVVFAASIGDKKHVVIDHGSGLRSTAAYLSSVSVVRGQRVGAGDVIAVAAAGFHLTARLGDTYIDPQLLLDGGSVSVRLTDVELRQRTARSIFGAVLALADAVIDVSFVPRVIRAATSVVRWHRFECTSDDVVVGPGGSGLAAPFGSGPAGKDSPRPERSEETGLADGRVLIQVGGLGTTSDGASIGALDAEALGYRSEDIIGFSYAGGCTPQPFGHDAVDAGSLTGEIGGGLGARPYDPFDTHQSIDVSAARLADLVDAVADARPGRSIDIAAHSLGGVVVRRALEMLDDRHPGGVPVDVAITIGSPHGGTDLATMAAASQPSVVAEVVLDPLIGIHADERHAPAVLDIAEAGGTALPPPGPPPDGVTVVTVAGSTDVIVPGEHAIWPGASNTVVNTSILDAFGVHGALPGHTAVARELELAIAGRPPRCVGMITTVGAALEANVISAAEDTITVAVGTIALLD